MANGGKLIVRQNVDRCEWDDHLSAILACMSWKSCKCQRKDKVGDVCRQTGEEAHSSKEIVTMILIRRVWLPLMV